MSPPLNAFYNEIVAQIRALVPAKLITVTFDDFEAGEAFRTYSTMSEAFPVGGRKAVADKSHWNHVIFNQKQCFIINRVRDYPEHFYDYEDIEKLGLCSALCAPIIDDYGKVVGTVNLLDAEGAYEGAPVDEIIKVIGQLSSIYEESLTLSKAV